MHRGTGMIEADTSILGECPPFPMYQAPLLDLPASASNNRLVAGSVPQEVADAKKKEDRSNGSGLWTLRG